VAGKAAGTWDRLEQVFEDRVARALGSLGVPSKQDIDRLSKRVVELSAAVQALTEGKTAPKIVAKPVVKEAATAAEPAAAKPAAARPATRRPAAKAAAAKPVPPVTPADVLNTIPQPSE
jgi:hypothetical protein